MTKKTPLVNVHGHFNAHWLTRSMSAANFIPIFTDTQAAINFEWLLEGSAGRLKLKSLIIAPELK